MRKRLLASALVNVMAVLVLVVSVRTQVRYGWYRESAIPSACSDTRYFIPYSMSSYLGIEIGDFIFSTSQAAYESETGPSRGVGNLLLITSADQRHLVDQVIGFSDVLLRHGHSKQQMTVILTGGEDSRHLSYLCRYLTETTGVRTRPEEEFGFLKAAPPEPYYALLVGSPEGRIVYVSQDITPCVFNTVIETIE